MKNKAEEILELHFGSDFWRIKEADYFDNTINAMEEYAQSFQQPSVDWDEIEKDFNEWLVENNRYSDRFSIFEWFKSKLQAESKDEWISVDERLPEEDKYVLVCFNGKHIFTGTYNNGQWLDSDGFKFIDGTITHWRELPEPPKEK